MFDTLNMITIQTLWNNDVNLDNINGLALDLKQSYYQSEILGCNVDGYINVYECLWLNDIQPYTLYLMIYECKV